MKLHRNQLLLAAVAAGDVAGLAAAGEQCCASSVPATCTIHAKQHHSKMLKLGQRSITGTVGYAPRLACIRPVGPIHDTFSTDCTRPCHAICLAVQRSTRQTHRQHDVGSVHSTLSGTTCNFFVSSLFRIYQKLDTAIAPEGQQAERIVAVNHMLKAILATAMFIFVTLQSS